MHCYIKHFFKNLILANYFLCRYILSGPKTGQYVDFSVSLPGEPDNISKSKRGTYWIGIASGRTKESPAPHDRFAEQPLLRKAFLITQNILLAPIATIMKLIPHKTVNEIGFEVSVMKYFELNLYI